MVLLNADVGGACADWFHLLRFRVMKYKQIKMGIDHSLQEWNLDLIGP